MMNFLFVAEIFGMLVAPIVSEGSNKLCGGMEKKPLSWTPSCNQSHVLSCMKTEVNLNALLQDQIELPGNIKMKIVSRGAYSAVFKDASMNEAVFSWNPMGELAGHITVDGHSYMLETCGKDCYAWVENDQLWKDEVGLEPEEDIQNSGNVVDDSSTVVDYSVMVWYTPEFRALFSDENAMNVFIDLIFVETNQGYVNSKIPVQAKKMCARQHPTLNDIQNPTMMIDAFSKSMSREALLYTGDAAVLLVADFGACGVAYPRTTQSCRTFSVVQKSCATGYYSFGHEIGHNFGAKHNPEVSKQEGYPGHGYLIKPENSGYRTILAYGATGHNNRINYYSNPRVVFPQTGTPTGEELLSDNARVITQNRFAMAACGDESLADQCSGSSAPSCPFTDKYSECPSWRNPHCTSGQFVQWMDYYCRKTCRCSSTPSSGACRTVSGPQPGAPCVFPFVLNGITHRSCTRYGGYSPWCSTRTDGRGQHLLGNYGDCDTNKCPVEN